MIDILECARHRSVEICHDIISGLRRLFFFGDSFKYGFYDRTIEICVYSASTLNNSKDSKTINRPYKNILLSFLIYAAHCGI